MLVYRTTATQFVDAVINHPEVRKGAGFTGERLSSRAVLDNHMNQCWAGEGGCLLFLYRQDGIYEAHVFLVPGYRGRAGIAFGRAALRALFGQRGVRKVVAEAPWELPAVRWYARRLGFVSLGQHPEQPAELFEMVGA